MLQPLGTDGALSIWIAQGQQLQLGVEGQGTHCLELQLAWQPGASFLFPWSLPWRPALASVLIKCGHSLPQFLSLVERESTFGLLPQLFLLSAPRVQSDQDFGALSSSV